MYQFINGKRVSGTAGSMPLIDPSTEEIIDELDIAGPAEVDAAVDAAATAFQKWSRATPAERSDAMTAWAALLLAFPLLLYQAYAFILPAFSPREREVALPLLLGERLVGLGDQDLLDRDLAAQPLVAGQPDRAHAAATDLRLQPVAPGDEPARGGEGG